MRKPIAGLIFCSSLVLFSCVGVNVRRVPNQILEVTGQATSAQLAALESQQGQIAAQATPQIPVSSAWANREIQTTVTVPPPSFSPGEETRRLFSRRKAVSDGYRNLAAQIEQMQMPDGRTVGAAISNEATKKEIETLIQQQSKIVEESEQPGGSYYIKMALRTDSLAQIMANAGAPGTSAAMQAFQAQRQQLQAIVQQEAERNARHKLLQQVSSELTNEPGVTIGEKMQEDPKYRQHVMSLIQQAPVQNTRFSRNGTCEVDLTLQLDQVRQG